MLSLEMCQQLKDAGFPQNTNLVYYNEQLLLTSNMIPNVLYMGKIVSCPSFDEIWAQLPNEIFHDKKYYHLRLTRLKEKSHTYIDYVSVTESGTATLMGLSFGGGMIMPTEAAAKLWLALKKINFTTEKPKNAQ